MRPLRTRILEARKRLGVPWEVLERDYLLSWLLAGIAEVASLRESLVFKGGTALKKCYFGNYRFSEDLDFSAIRDVPTREEMTQAVQDVCSVAMKLLNEHAPVQIVSQRYVEKEPHPAGQEAFIIRAQFPWQNEANTRVMIETTLDERLLLPTVTRKIIHEYGEPLDVSIQAYPLEEILAEKLRSILQHAEQLKQRGWSRSRARDYYDIWRMLADYKDNMDLTDFSSLLREKCAVRNVRFSNPEDFFEDAMLANIEKTWDQWLGPLVPALPSFATVIGELRPQIAALVQGPR